MSPELRRQIEAALCIRHCLPADIAKLLEPAMEAEAAEMQPTLERLFPARAVVRAAAEEWAAAASSDDLAEQQESHLIWDRAILAELRRRHPHSPRPPRSAP